MKKFLALLVSVILLIGLLAGFPASGLEETGSAADESAVDYENSMDGTEEEGTSEDDYPELFNNVLNISKAVVDKDGQPYSGDLEKDFTVHVTGPREYNKIITVRANMVTTLSDLPAGTFEIREEVTEGYTRIDENGTVTYEANYIDRHFPDSATAELGKQRDGAPVADSRDDAAAAIVDETDATEAVDGAVFLSLGIGGIATFEYERPFYNGPDVDLRIREITLPEDESYESARVEASKTGEDDSWYTLGFIAPGGDGDENGFYNFDLGDLDWAKYIRICDLSNIQYFSETASDTGSPEIPNTTGDGAEYTDPDDGVDIDYVCTRYTGEVGSVEIKNRHETKEEPPVVNPSTTTPTHQNEYYKLTTAVSGQGTILPGPGTSSFGGGLTVQLKPEPAAGWESAGWQGDTVNDRNEIYMDGDKSVTAVFKEITEAPAAQPEPEEPAEADNEIQAPEEPAAPAIVSVEEEELPAALPKTSGFPAFIFVGAGSALVLLGVVTGFKRK